MPNFSFNSHIPTLTTLTSSFSLSLTRSPDSSLLTRTPFTLSNLSFAYTRRRSGGAKAELTRIFTVLVSWTWPQAAQTHTLSHTALYNNIDRGRRLGLRVRPQGRASKGPPAHAHNILHPLSDECAAPGPSGFAPRRSLTGWPRRHPTDLSPILPSLLSPLSPLRRLSCV